MKTLQLGQTYPTRDGNGSGKVVADNLSGDHPFCVILTRCAAIIAVEYKADGTYDFASDEDWFLIIPERKMRTVYVNLTPDQMHLTPELARGACARRADDTYRFIALPVEVPAE